ncbi:MAG TPA: hypothetical protein DCL15_15015 [Chloroflexi bacterium]|nr:hypothetical protein [Chloroflexota bacterium]HHW85818.1 hypothetical protein [Chloroflexota bacterium]
MPSGVRNQWLVVIFALGCLLFSFPLLALFNHADLLFGVPLSVLYVFAAWLLIIGLTFLSHEQRN